MEIGFLVVIVLLVFLLSSMIKIASENERFAAIRLADIWDLKGQVWF